MNSEAKIRISIVLVLLAALVPEAGAAEYPSGHRALEVFDAEGRRATPSWVMGWIVASTLCFAAGLCFVRQHAIARWVVGGYVAGFSTLVASSVFDTDLLRLSGFNALVHLIFWTPALVQLLSKRPFFSRTPTPFSIWSGVITAVMLFSYVFDVPYALTYLNHVLFEL